MSNARKLADNLPSEGQLGNRNLIINGAMTVAQRATSGSISTSTPNYASVDRFKTEAYAADQFAGTWAQVTDAPTGFSYSVKWTTTTAETAIDAAELFDVRHIIEAQNVTHLEYGSSDAKTCTLSFYVKASVTGTFTCNIYNLDSNRHLVIEYTINASNTWEKKTLTIVGDTGGSNFNNDTGGGLQITWNLAAGSDYSGTAVTGSWAAYSGPAFAGANQSNAIGTTLNATWQLTGVQLEVGSQSTPFEHETFDTTLRKCQRYFCRTYQYGTGTGTATSSGCVATSLSATFSYAGAGTWQFPVSMRAAPSVTVYSTATGTSGKLAADGTDANGNATFITQDRCFFYRVNNSSGTAANVFLRAQATASAEL